MDGLGLIEESVWVKVCDAGASVEKWVDAGCPVGESLTSYTSFLETNTFFNFKKIPNKVLKMLKKKWRNGKQEKGENVIKCKSR